MRAHRSLFYLRTRKSIHILQSTETRKGLPESNEMVLLYWWPECLPSTIAGNTMENKVYLELFNALFVQQSRKRVYFADNYSFCCADGQDKPGFQTINWLCFFWQTPALRLKCRILSQRLNSMQEDSYFYCTIPTK